MKKVLLCASILAVVMVMKSASTALANSEIILAGSRRVGDVVKLLAVAYQKKNPDVEVKILRSTLKEAQERLMKKEADGVLVTKKYYKELDTTKLKFTPIAKRIVEVHGKVTTYIDYGIASLEVSSELEKFLDFIRSDEGKERLKSIPNVAPL
ncbi:MAG TPA: hypothetical protein EYP78_01930 [Candidatus Omnitrophica bacterium]|nr:hypothetical protein [Candidatus Omnitrophota bacterium]